MTDDKVIEHWAEFCASPSYFLRYREATESADLRLNGEITYGVPASNAEKIGTWCQCFWEALPDLLDIRTGPFFMICEIAEWRCYNEPSSPASDLTNSNEDDYV